MESSILQDIPPDFIKFILVVLFSLLIGLEQRRQHIELEFESLFGTDRTFTLIGILGYILYIISPKNLMPFLGGGTAIAGLLGIFYFQKISLNKKFGLTSLIIALITYCLAPLIYTQPYWLSLLIVVCILIIKEIKESLFKFSQKFDNNEFITLAKFLVLAGVILPLLPNTPISPEITITPFQCGLAVVAVSAISYFSYLLKKFVFPDSGILLTGILGGLYSSTATTVILARKSREDSATGKIVPAIFAAQSMMYLRIFLLALFFNASVAISLLPYFIILIVITLFLVFYFTNKNKKSHSQTGNETVKSHDNPLEFKTALLFAALFIFFGIVTGYVMRNYGGAGINIMGFVVGVTDINPFVLNLFQSKGTIENSIIAVATLNAITSNIFFQLIYALVLSDKALRKQLITGFSILIVTGLVLALLMSFHVI
jgi:uncharacterized membrane protein (DUF4010 family)